jgi:hypothetical protein
MITLQPLAAEALQARILKDLSAGQSTADSTAERLKIPTQLCEQLCHELEAKGKLETLTIAQTLTVYRLR